MITVTPSDEKILDELICNINRKIGAITNLKWSPDKGAVDCVYYNGYRDALVSVRDNLEEYLEKGEIDSNG